MISWLLLCSDFVPFHALHYRLQDITTSSAASMSWSSSPQTSQIVVVSGELPVMVKALTTDEYSRLLSHIGYYTKLRCLKRLE